MPPPDRRVAAANRLIASLPLAERERIISRCATTRLGFGATIYKPGETIRYVYFPTTGYISLISPAGAAESIEVGMVGNEGMFGITLLLDVKASPLLGLVQGEGEGLRMGAQTFRAAVYENPVFRKTLNRYLYVLTSQLAQTAACNRFHLLDARLARWLLMSLDRAHSNTYRLTHEFLAYMLGVRRTGVTEAAGRLQAKELIRYSRGKLTVLDRPGLEEVACPCYKALTSVYVKHLGNAPPAGRAKKEQGLVRRLPNNA
jgi:CRP-like cAMP-binding protein